jgi:hypothetical protein
MVSDAQRMAGVFTSFFLRHRMARSLRSVSFGQTGASSFQAAWTT